MGREHLGTGALERDLWHLSPMLLRTLAVLPFVLACRSSLSEPEASHDVLPEAAATDTPEGEDPDAWIRDQMEGPSFEREYATTLAVLVPRELSGAEANDRARRAFAALEPDEQTDLLEWFTVECEKLGTFQGTLIRYVLDATGVDESTWPDLAPLSWYDPGIHAPGQPIPRKPLAADAPDAVAVRNQIHGAVGTRRLDSGWMVDYAARGLVRLPGQGDARRVFENGLLGMAPDWDLAEALVELALDDGSLQKSFEAFAHAYTDRWGGVYPGVTLYDAQASLLQTEMPDVDALGLVHDLTGDWETWNAPVPPEEHQALYARVAELFRAVLRHRGLRANLARTYLCGSAELRDGYANNVDNFHALWESVSSEPDAMRAKLPDEAGWREFLSSWDAEMYANPETFLKGTRRHAALEHDAELVRGTLLRLLGEYGAFARIETLPPFDE